MLEVIDAKPPAAPFGAGVLPLALAGGRLHEGIGPARVYWALAVARLTGEAVLWLPAGPAWPTPHELAAFLPPDRFILVPGTRHEERLWAMEEALRSGGFGAVVAEIERPLSLTAGRRLQLAAEAGACLALALGGRRDITAATETRWYTDFACSDDQSVARWHWRLVKNKRGPVGRWMIDWRSEAAAPFTATPLPAADAGASLGAAGDLT